MNTYSLVIVHEDGATISAMNLPYEVASARFDNAAQTDSVVYARWSDDAYQTMNHYVRVEQ